MIRSCRNAACCAILLFMLSFAGCGYFRVPGLTLILVNQSSAMLHNIEVDYPGGSFGVSSLPPNGRWTRWIKVNSAGELKTIFNDSAGEHRETLLTLARYDTGEVEVHFLDSAKAVAVDHRKRR